LTGVCGGKCLTPHAHKEGIHCVAAGNRLVSPSIVDAMISTFEAAEKQVFAERLLLAMEAGERQGGDAPGRESAMLSIVPARIRENWPANVINVRVDHHVDPVCELRRLYGIFASRNKSYSDTPGS